MYENVDFDQIGISACTTIFGCPFVCVNRILKDCSKNA